MTEPIMDIAEDETMPLLIMKKLWEATTAQQKMLDNVVNGTPRYGDNNRFQRAHYKKSGEAIEETRELLIQEGAKRQELESIYPTQKNYIE